MQNALLFYYNLYIEKIHKKKDNYHFTYNNCNYILYLYNRNLNDAISIYNLNQELLHRNSKCHIIILNTQNNILSFIDNKYYILMKIQSIIDRTIDYSDILSFNYEIINNNYINLTKNNWSTLWENKIDYFEYQFPQIKDEYPLFQQSINYFLGLWENAISYYNRIVKIPTKLYVVHNRLHETTTLTEFYNPLNLIIDYKARDIAEYIKSYAMNKNITKQELDSIISSSKLNQTDLELLITRLLFPSYYFDIYEDVVNNKKSDHIITTIIEKVNGYEDILKYIFNRYSKESIPIINWIIKKD